MSHVEQALRETLYNRIGGDSRYMQHRLGRVAAPDEIMSAIPDELLSRAMAAMGLALDEYEEEIWNALEDDAA